MALMSTICGPTVFLSAKGRPLVLFHGKQTIHLFALFSGTNEVLLVRPTTMDRPNDCGPSIYLDREMPDSKSKQYPKDPHNWACSGGPIFSHSNFRATLLHSLRALLHSLRPLAESECLVTAKSGSPMKFTANP